MANKVIMENDHQSAQFLLDWLRFLFEQWKFIVGLLIGGGATHTFTKIVVKKKNIGDIKQEGRKNQGTQIIDSPHSSAQTAGRDALQQEGKNGVLASIHDSPGASIFFNNSQPRVSSSKEALSNPSAPLTDASISLNANQSHIFQKVQETLQGLDIHTSFQARYQNAINHINNNNARVGASEYHAAFINILPTFLDRNTYGINAPTEEDLNSMRETFEAVHSFLSSSSDSHSALKITIDNFENALMVTLGYL